MRWWSRALSFLQIVHGDNAAVVQFNGNNNTVTISSRSAELVLDRRHKLKGVPANELELLLTDLRATELVGRDEDLALLQGWLDKPDVISVRCLVGRAGSGKTRIAIELCERAELQGWVAGFARQDELQRFFGSQNLSNWRWRGSTLVVIDYAAASERILRQWMEVLAKRVPNRKDPRLRILLLERDANWDFGWWAELTRAGGLSGRGPDSLIDPAGVVTLPNLQTIEQRRRLLSDVMRQAARIADIAEVPQPPAPGADPNFDRQLGDDTIDNEPLYLLMAGLVAVTAGASAAVAQTRADLATQIGAAERNRLNRLAQGWNIDPNFFTHLAACVSLEGGCDQESAERLVDGERVAMTYATSISTEELVARLGDALPPRSFNLRVAAVAPNLVGEAFLLTEIARNNRSAKNQIAIIERAWRRAGVRVAATVIRTAQDYAGNHQAHPSLAWFDHLINIVADDSELAFLGVLLPRATVALRERAVTLQERIVQNALSLGDPKRRSTTASALAQLAIRLADLGRRDDALEAARKAVEVYREVASSGFEQLGLAAALTNFANTLGDVGNSEEAVVVAREARDIYSRVDASYSRLYGLTPKYVRRNFAAARGNLATALRAVGQREEALSESTEAISLYRSIAPLEADDDQADFADILNNHTNLLSDHKNDEGALATSQEVIKIFSTLAGRNPDAFQPALARAIGNSVDALSMLGRLDEALEAARATSEIYAGLSTRYPDAFQLEYATSLRNLALALGKLGHHAESLTPAKQAVDITKRLFGKNRSMFGPNFAESLTTLAMSLRDNENPRGALPVVKHAISVYREIAGQREAYRSYLAAALGLLSFTLRDLGRYKEALAAAQEDASIFRQLHAEHPDVYEERFAGALKRLGSRLTDCMRNEEAAAIFGEAEKLSSQPLAIWLGSSLH